MPLSDSYEATSTRARRARRIAEGKCTQCGAGLLELVGWTRRMCPECNEQKRLRAEKRRKKKREHLNLLKRQSTQRNAERINAEKREKYAQRKVEGMCCEHFCSLPANEVSGFCEEHYQYRLSVQRSYRRRFYLKAKKNRKCVRCGGDKDRGYSTCARCRANAIKWQTKHREKKKQQEVAA